MLEDSDPPLDALADRGSFRPVEDELRSRDPLQWPGYAEALEEAQRRGSDESVHAGPARIGGRDVELALFDFGFFGGSMGEVAGERIASALERAASRGVPFVLRTSTGGARMQEGMVSLVQMPKVVAARVDLGAVGQPFVVVLGHPTTGGVLASIGALADYTIAEEDATIAFAGPRVAERITGRRQEPLSAADLLARGLVDKVVPAAATGEHVAAFLAALDPDAPEDIGSPPEVSAPTAPDPWEVVSAARDPERPDARATIQAITSSLVTLHGDRSGNLAGGITGVARIAGTRCMVIGTDRYLLRPGDYRKAIRCVEVASRLGLPVVTVVDTPGADPSEASEREGIAWAIARLAQTMLSAPVPIVAVVTGEGGSGGALAFATADVVLMCSDAFFSVIGPEAAAAILWRDEARAAEAARSLRLTAHNLHELGTIDEILPRAEDTGAIRGSLAYHLARLEEDSAPGEARAERRRRRWRSHGQGR